MKGAVLFIALFALALLMIPMIAMSFETDMPMQPAQVHTPSLPIAEPETTPNFPPEPVAPAAALELPQESETETLQLEKANISKYGVASFRIFNEATGEVETVSLRDYVRGAVAAEMPVSFHPEALKAQAVAAHTFALHNHIVQQQNPDPALKGADFAADPDNMLVYITEEKAREFYGNNAEQYWKKICAAADSAVLYVLEYEEEPIVAAYHAISAGQTEDAGNVWTGVAPYLRPADSRGDLLAPDYETTVKVSTEQMAKKIGQAYPDTKLSDDPESWFDAFERSDSGYVTAVEVGGQTIHGKDIRTLFDLRSHNFDLTYDDSGGFQFTVYGYGHGVGLSQYGADFLARQGYTFDEILENYYTDTALRKIEL